MTWTNDTAKAMESPPKVVVERRKYFILGEFPFIKDSFIRSKSLGFPRKPHKYLLMKKLLNLILDDVNQVHEKFQFSFCGEFNKKVINSCRLTGQAMRVSQR